MVAGGVWVLGWLGRLPEITEKSLVGEGIHHFPPDLMQRCDIGSCCVGCHGVALGDRRGYGGVGMGRPAGSAALVLVGAATPLHPEPALFEAMIEGWRRQHAHPRRRGADFLRHLLVAHRALPPRDDALARLQTWVAARLEAIEDPHQRRLLRSYATWRVLRRARQRPEHAPAARTPTGHAKANLRAAIAFVEFLDHRGHQLAGCTQTDIDAWLDQGPPCAPQIADFVDWAATRKLIEHVTIPAAPRREGHALDDDARWAIVRRLLHDNAIDLGDRVAGCLILLYGQQLSHIVALTRDQITVTNDTTRLHLGATHIEIPEPLAGLLTRLAHTRRPYTGIGSPPDIPWLFPGLDPGRPLTTQRLGQRLRRLHISAAPGRRAALTHLAARLPATTLANLLNLAPTTAVRWVRAAGGDWNTHAAQLVRDRDREP